LLREPVMPTSVRQGSRRPSQTPFTQARWAQRGPSLDRALPAVDFLLDSIRRHPGEITLLASAR